MYLNSEIGTPKCGRMPKEANRKWWRWEEYMWDPAFLLDSGASLQSHFKHQSMHFVPCTFWHNANCVIVPIFKHQCEIRIQSLKLSCRLKSYIVSSYNSNWIIIFFKKQRSMVVLMHPSLVVRTHTQKKGNLCARLLSSSNLIFLSPRECPNHQGMG